MASPNVEGRYQRRKWSAKQRLDYYSIPGPNGCILFAGAKDKNGYGKLRINGRDVRSHRIAWELVNGPIPVALHVCHRCDTPACINPDHLFLGTNEENIADKVAKKRQARGAAHGRTFLTEEKAIEVYLAKGREIDIAARYGIGKTTVGHIKRRETWKHLHTSTDDSAAKVLAPTTPSEIKPLRD